MTARHTTVRPRRRQPRRLLVATVLVGTVLTAGTLLARDPDPVGHFRTEEGRLAYRAAYDAALAELPAPTRTLDLSTDYGLVRVYAFGPADGAAGVPVVLLPGRSSGVPMWEANLSDLAAVRTVYALDALGDAGLSEQTRPIRDGADQAAWLDQALAQLPGPTFHLVGHSFGGWLAANYAVRHPQRVRSLALLEPVFVYAGLRPSIYLMSLPASLPFLPRSWRDAMLADIGGVESVDPDDPLTAMIAAATDHYALKLPLPRRLTTEQLQALALPVFTGLGGRSTVHDPVRAAATARATVPDLQLRVWPAAGHSLPMDHPAEVDAELLAFLAAHDPS